MIDPSYKEEQKAELKANGFSTHVYCVENIAAACESAKKLTTSGAQLIELCGAFNEKMVTQIIESVNGKVPVGNMTMRPDELEKLMIFLKKEETAELA